MKTNSKIVTLLFLLSVVDSIRFRLCSLFQYEILLTYRRHRLLQPLEEKSIKIILQNKWQI